MKIQHVLMTLVFLFSASPAVAGRFECRASNFATVEISAATADEPGFPLKDRVMVSIEGAPFFLEPEQITRYENSISSAGDRVLRLTARHKSTAKTILELETRSGIGHLSVDHWNIYLNKVEARCAY